MAPIANPHSSPAYTAMMRDLLQRAAARLAAERAAEAAATKGGPGNA